eukprot:jgi/Botrbrau1/21782/Bobra.0190s0009.1
MDKDKDQRPRLRVRTWQPSEAHDLPPDLVDFEAPTGSFPSAASEPQPVSAAPHSAPPGSLTTQHIPRMTPKTPMPLTPGGSTRLEIRQNYLDPSRSPPATSIDDQSVAVAALLSLNPEAHKDAKPSKAKSTAAAGGDRARPGPRPQSKFMGVTRHVKGMYNAQLWLAGQTRQEHVGGFGSTVEAAAAHDLAALTIKGSQAKTNFQKDMYEIFIGDLRGLDWPQLRAAIKVIIRDRLTLPDIPGVVPPPPPKPVKPLGIDGSPPPHNKTWARDAETPRAVTPMKHAEEQNTTTPDGSVPASDRSSPVMPAGAPPETPAVRKSGRQQVVPGRLKALNGEDDKLAHAKRRKRRKKMDPHEE